MDRLRKYDIAFVGLRQGTTDFEYEANDAFFALFDGSIIQEASIKVDLKFDKQPDFFLLDFHCSGTVQWPCNRCGAGLEVAVENEYRFVVKFDGHSEEEQDDSQADVIYIGRNDSHLNVAQLIYEFVSLSLPVHHMTCDNMSGKKPCDEEVLKRLDIQPNNAVKRDHRWDDLAKIKIK